MRREGQGGRPHHPPSPFRRELKGSQLFPEGLSVFMRCPCQICGNKPSSPLGLPTSAYGMAEMALNPTDSLSLPLYFIYIFLNEYLGDHCCWLNTVINRVLLFFTENHYKSNPCFRGREQHSTPNHTKRPRIPIYL